MNFTDYVRCETPIDWWDNFSQCLYEWQSLEAAILALIAAAISVYFLRRQIQQTDHQESKRLRRQHNAVRTTLPLTLSGLGQTLRKMLMALNAAGVKVRRQGYVDDFQAPETPVSHIAELQAVVASTDDPSVTELISRIVREIQILWSRVEMLTDRAQQERTAGLMESIDDWIIQAAQAYALSESLFRYARMEDDSGPSEVTWERAETILFVLNIESQSLVKRVREGLERSNSFWRYNGN